MPDKSLMEVFPTPGDEPFVVEHVNGEFTSVLSGDGSSGLRDDHGAVLAARGRRRAVCACLESLKLYFQSFRNEGIYYEAVTNVIRDDLAAAMNRCGFR
ncbi:MAG: NADPH-dependent 7-cyano-7-deazaguanine reductase QueF [Phycisphaerales bacterium]